MEQSTNLTMSKLREDQLIVKLLKEGDQVLNVSYIGDQIHIVVRKKDQQVFVYAVSRDENGQPKLSKSPEIIITHGDGEVEARATDPTTGEEIFSLTA